MIIKGSFKVPIYDAIVKIIVADNILRSLNYHLIKQGYKPEKSQPTAYFIHGGDDNPYIMFFRKDKLTINAVNHEKSHVVEKILTDCCIKPIDEVRSYLDGFVSDKTEKFFKKTKLKLE